MNLSIRIKSRPVIHRPNEPCLAAVAGAVAALLVCGGAAAAGSPTEARARKALKQAVEEDYLETRFDDAEQRLRGALRWCGTGDDSPCPVELRAKLHAALGAVLAVGKKQLEDARDEFVEALQLDRSSEPDPNVVSAEVTFAYEQARKKLKLTGKQDEPPTKPDADEPKGGPSKEPAPPKPPRKPPRKNWFSLTFSPDVSIISGTNVCTQESQANGHFVCGRGDGSRYVGTPTRDNADNINLGVGLSTLRLMLGYDRLLIDNLTLGARVGFAFNGAGVTGASFLPLHVEARVGFWPGDAPFSGSVVRPYLMLSGGVAQIDTKASVQVLEDGVACGASNPGDITSPCTKRSSDGVLEARKQDLTAYRQTGLGFASLTAGVQLAPTSAVALFVGVRGSVTLPVVSGVLSPEGGVTVGF